MAGLSKVACDLLQLVNDIGLDRDSCIGVMIELGQDKTVAEANYLAMYEWLTGNPKATHEQVFDKLDEILNQ